MERPTISSLKPAPTPTLQAGKRTVLLITTLSSFLTPFMVSSVTVAIPSIGKEFAMDAVLLSWIPTTYLLSAAIFLVPLGKIADIYGRKKLLLLGMAIFTSASLLCGLAGSGSTLIALRHLRRHLHPRRLRLPRPRQTPLNPTPIARDHPIPVSASPRPPVSASARNLPQELS